MTTQRLCIFCGKPADDKEHVWPDWALQRLKGKRQPMKGFIGKRKIEFGGSNPHLRIRCVCGECNHGWMSQLENINIPVIGSLMQDISFSLDRQQQWYVAAWAIKTSMVMQASTARSDAPFYNRAEHEQLRLSLAIPALTQAWLGRYSGENRLGIYGTYFWEGGRPNEPGTIHGCANTIFVGCLAIQVLTLRSPRDNSNRPITVEPSTGPWETLLASIWPPSGSVTWPPRRSFRDKNPFPWPALVKRWSTGETIE
jgi:hypothetical protein